MVSAVSSQESLQFSTTSAEEIACQAAALTPHQISYQNFRKFIFHKYLNIGALLKNMNSHQHDQSSLYHCTSANQFCGNII